MAQTKVAARRVALIACSLTALTLRPMPTATMAPSLRLRSSQVARERRVVPDADLDDAKVLRPLDHAAHGCAADAQAARQLVLGLPVDEVKRAQARQLLRRHSL